MISCRWEETEKSLQQKLHHLSNGIHRFTLNDLDYIHMGATSSRDVICSRRIPPSRYGRFLILRMVGASVDVLCKINRE